MSMPGSLVVAVLCGAVVLLASPAIADAQAGAGNLAKTVKGKVGEELANRGIEGLLVDDAAGSVSAASLAGIEADSLNVVENVRDFSVLLKAFDSEDKGFGLSIAPARTKFPIPRINLNDYAQDNAYLLRLLGGVTLSYAQGKVAVSGVDYTRRAISIATNAYFRAADDPLVAVLNAKECGHAALDSVPDERPSISGAQAARAVHLAKLDAAAAAGDNGAKGEVDSIKLKAAGGDKGAIADAEEVYEAGLRRRQAAGDTAAKDELLARLQKSAREGSRAGAEQTKVALEAFNTCADAVLKKHAEKWNRTRYAISYATGSIKQSDGGGPRETLGRTLALTFLYGFDGIKMLQDRTAVALTARRSQSEPVLESLGTASVKRKNSTLVALRLSGGSSVFRGLVEANNAKETEVTTTQRTLRRALGVDYRIMDGLWLNLRYGKQRKIDGTGDETGSFLVLNYSPSALLGR